MRTQLREPAIERRFVSLEVRALDEDDPDSRRIGGHAAVFDQLSVELDAWLGKGFKEKIKRGAFRQSLKEDDPVALWQHDPSFPLGRMSTGTLTAKEDKEGLAFEVDVAETNMGNDALVSIRRGDVHQVSFGFITLDDSWETIDGDDVRTLKRVRLMDISPVTYPAYPQTDVAVRSLRAYHGRLDEGRAAIASHSTPTTDAAWDGAAARQNTKSDQDLAYYRQIFGWRDPDEDVGSKSSYKFPHHEVSADGTPGAANMKGCSATIGALNGARTPTTIPDADRQGVYDHVVRHLKDGDQEEIPELQDRASIVRRTIRWMRHRLIDPAA